jgi:hypothetical protein
MLSKSSARSHRMRIVVGSDIKNDSQDLRQAKCAFTLKKDTQFFSGKHPARDLQEGNPYLATLVQRHVKPSRNSILICASKRCAPEFDLTGVHRTSSENLIRKTAEVPKDF